MTLILKGETRQRLSLDGVWQFRFEDGPWRQAEVPMPWQAQFADLADSHGTAVYKRRFVVPQEWAGLEVALRFGAVSYFCRVSVNGTLLGTHEGAYLPFEFVLPDGLAGTECAVEIEVVLPSSDPALYPDFPFDEVPHGKQSWYGRVGGLWQSVLLEARSRQRLVRTHVDAGMDGVVRAALAFTPEASGLHVRVDVVDADGVHVAGADAVAAEEVAVEITVPGARLWDVGQPNLYWLVASLGDGMDVARERFGFRSVSTGDGNILLNGRPVYMRGALDQDYYTNSLYTTPSLALLEDQARKAITLGLNTLRCHIKVPDPRYYDVADRFGLLVWTEVPNVARFTEQSSRRIRETLTGILARDRNHPSIIAWTIINEDWGTRLVENPAQRQWLIESYDWLKAEDPTRLVVDNSACFPNFHVKTDLNDFHYYRSVPERRQEWDELTEQFAANPDWTFSQMGDAQRRGDEPLIVSEFGVWGLPDPAKLRGTSGSEPDWFESGSVWGDGAAYPHGIEQRFSAFGLAAAFGNLESFVTAAQWYQFANLRYEIEEMRRHSAIAGYVITELTDVHWEANGLLDMERNPRVFHDVFSTINTDIVIVPRPDRYAAYGGSILGVAVSIASGGLSVPSGATLRWSGDATGSMTVPQMGSMQAETLPVLQIEMPETASSRMARVEFMLDAAGTVLARNSLDIALYAPRRKADITVGAHDADLAEHATGLGYAIVPPEAADVVLCRTLDEGRLSAIKAGARYLVIADGAVATPQNLRTDQPEADLPYRSIVLDGVQFGPPGDHYEPGMRLFQRHGTIWRGDWIAGFSWLQRSGPFARIPGGPLFDLSFSNVVPRCLLSGFRPWEFNDAVSRVHAGIVVGWVHKPAAIITEKHIGRGGMMASTFRLMGETPGVDPVATALFDALLEATAGMGQR